ncbi:MAG: DedA family protein [Bacteroidia bacterium]|nr:DedA family protein [Bacteroidia bacterium]MDW8089184.1 DedA family protein [Bacteroidia bacterium]
MLEKFYQLFNPQTIIYVGGLGLLLGIVFAETGLLIGVIFPGDSLLFTTGLLTAGQVIDLPVGVVIGGISAAAFLGDQSGYWIGWRTGRTLFRRPRSLLFRPEYVEATRRFYHRYGAWVLVVGKFLPVIRTFAPLLAGVIQMPYWKYLGVSLTGAILWPAVLVSAGYFLGGVAWVQAYYEWIILGMVVLTTGPVLWRIFQSRLPTKVSV